MNKENGLSMSNRLNLKNFRPSIDLESVRLLANNMKNRIVLEE